MEKLALLALTCVAIGCKHNEFDVSPGEVTTKLKSGHGPGMGMPDFNHLPPGAIKHEQKFKKGDTLPDGTIADRDQKIFHVEFPEGATIPGLPPGSAKGKRIIMEDDVQKK